MLLPQGLHTSPLTAMTTHLPPQLSLRQQQIRMNIESEIARAIPIAGPSAPQQQRDDYEIAKVFLLLSIHPTFQEYES